MPVAVGPWRVVGLNLVVALAYAALGAVGLVVQGEWGLAAPVWPAAGIAMAVVLTYGWRLAPGVFLGSVLVTGPQVVGAVPNSVTAIVAVAAVASGVVLQAAVGAALVRRTVDPRLALATAGDIVRFLVLAGPLACLVSATIGLSAQLWAGIVPTSGFVMPWLNWWVGDSIGVIVFAPITLMLLPPWRGVWAGRRLTVAIPSLTVVLIASWFFLSDAAVEVSVQDRIVGRVALEAEARLDVTLERQLAGLVGISGLVTSSDAVSRREFATFTRGALADPRGLRALAWDAWVPNEQLPAFVDWMRTEGGVPGFDVTERSAEGVVVPVADRPVHVVVAFIEPLSENAEAVGFDVMSGERRAQTVLAARDSGEARATPPIELVVGEAGQPGVLVYLPVYRGGVVPATTAERAEAIQGFAVGVYLMDDLLAATFDSPAFDGVDLQLLDVTEGEGPVVLATRGSMDERGAPRRVAQTREVGGRTWELIVQPTWGVDGLAPPSASPEVLLSGLAVTLLLEAFLLLLTGTERRARRDAEISSFEANHDSLTGLFNRRAFIELLRMSRDRAVDEASRHVLLFMDLDGFKAVNDTAGHDAGDAMLAAVARALSGSIRERDVVARIGGDEFAAILNNCPEERGLSIAESMTRAVDSCRAEGFPGTPGVGLSVGLAMIDGVESVSIDELMQRADRACYDAKNAGRGLVRRFTHAYDL